MALNEQRVFKAHDGWWVAQVLMASAASSGEGAQLGRGQDTVFFSTIGRDEEQTRTASIPAGFLRKLSHRGILAVLDRATPFGSFVHLSPANLPHADTYGNNQVVDSDGLRWGFRVVRTSRLGANGQLEGAAKVVLDCFDDSMLSGSIGVDSEETWELFMQTHGHNGVLDLVKELTRDRKEDPGSMGTRA